jgi:hypothetical protein
MAKRTKKLTVPMTDLEMQELGNLAERAGMPLTVYIRQLVKKEVNAAHSVTQRSQREDSAQGMAQ